MMQATEITSKEILGQRGLHSTANRTTSSISAYNRDQDAYSINIDRFANGTKGSDGS
jgi:hypothetical protein